MKRFGLCVWDDWGDYKIDRPDNISETLLSFMIEWLDRKGFLNIDDGKIYQFQPFEKFITYFVGDNCQLREKAYNSMIDFWDINDASNDFPELDCLFVRWRWDLGLDNDKRVSYQEKTLEHYLKTDTRIYIWDADCQMSQDDKALMIKHGVTLVDVAESALGATDVINIPFSYNICIDTALGNVLQGSSSNSGDHLDENFLLSYVGNNYEREEYVEKYLKHVSDFFPKQVHLFGNWLKYNNGVKARFENISFHPKVNKSMLQWVYRHSIAVPLITKRKSFIDGRISPRLIEVLSAGSIPIGFKEFKNYEKYFNFVAESDKDLVKLVNKIKGFSFEQRKSAVFDQLNLLNKNKIFDVDYFFKRIDILPTNIV